MMTHVSWEVIFLKIFRAVCFGVYGVSVTAFFTSDTILERGMISDLRWFVIHSDFAQMIDRVLGFTGMSYVAYFRGLLAISIFVVGGGFAHRYLVIKEDKDSLTRIG